MKPASPDLRQRLRVVSRSIGLTALWRWWRDELAPLVPRRLRNAVGRIRMRPVLVWGESNAVLWVPEVADNGVAYKEAAQIPLSGDDDAAGRAAIEALSISAGAQWTDPTRVIVALPAEQVLRKTISLPAAVEDNLAQVLAYDLDRHTPFKPEEVYFDARIVGRDTAKKELRVDWTAARKSVVDQARRRAESWGAAVIAVTPDLPTVGSPRGSALNLIPEGDRPEASPLQRWEIWAPIALIVVALIFATALPLWQKRGYAIALMQQASQWRAQADASAALRDQLERLTGDYNFALSKKYAYPSALQSVDDVTKLLPDDTWLTQFEMKTSVKGKESKREVMVRGESVNAGRLVSLFEDSKLFGETAPRSPTTKIQPGPGEIFDLGAQLKPLPPPVPVATAAGTTSAPPATPGMPNPAVAASAPAPGAGSSPVAAPGSTTPPGPEPAAVAPAKGAEPAKTVPPPGSEAAGATKPGPAPAGKAGIGPDGGTSPPAAPAAPTTVPRPATKGAP